MISTRIEGSIAVVTIDSPPVNALPMDSWRDIAAAITAASASIDVRAIVLQGVDGSFCAGADIRGLAASSDDADPALLVVGDTASAIRDARPPIIAAIDGPAHGGGLELALACDIRLASRRATFAAAGVNMGLVASVGSLIAAVGDSRARAMLLTATRIEVDQAEHWGLITSITDNPHSDAYAMAERIAAKPPLAVEATKRLAQQHARVTEEEHEQLMHDGFVQLSRTSDHAEALASFLEKRPGAFTRT